MVANNSIVDWPFLVILSNFYFGLNNDLNIVLNAKEYKLFK